MIAIRVDPRILSVVVEGLRAALRADVIDVTLRENRAHPRQDRAAAVEVFEYRAPPPVAHLEAIKVGPDRIGEFAPANLITSDRARRGIERRPKARDEVLPRARVSTFARDRKREILRMERIEISLDGVALDRARFKRPAKRRLGHRVFAKIPLRGPSAIVEPRKRRRVSGSELWRAVAHMSKPTCE